jgi:hypothetical protein
MACFDNTLTTAGTTIAIGPSPAANTAAAFGAVTLKLIGEITSIGEVGKTYNTATRTPLASRAVIEKKTSYTRSSPSLSLAIADDDAGQIAAKEALDSDDCYTICITRQNGSKKYFTAQVSAFTVSYDTDEFENGSITLLAQSDVIEVP